MLVFRGGSTLEGCEVLDNFAVAQTGGVHVVGGDSVLLGTVIRGNDALTIGGGLGVYPEDGVPDGEDGTTTTVTDCVIEENTCKQSGGGMWIRPGYSTVFVEGTTICGNEPDEVDGEFVDLGKNELCGCPGDVNFDGTVNGADISVLLGYWGTSGQPVSADVNRDGVVNGADLAELLGSWGPCK